MEATFTVKTKEIKTAMAFMERVGSEFSRDVILKISVLPETIELSKQGIMQKVKAETAGLADVLVPAVLLKSYLNTATSAVITFTFTHGEMKCGSSIFSSPAISVETVFNIPENTLPINATRMSVLRFAATKTDEEIARLGLTATIKSSKRQLTTKIQKATELLKDYEIGFEEIRALIDRKISE